MVGSGLLRLATLASNIDRKEKGRNALFPSAIIFFFTSSTVKCTPFFGTTCVVDACDRTGNAPDSQLCTCALASSSTECGGWVRCVRRQIWLPIVPERTQRPASLPVRAAIWSWRALTEGSPASLYMSSWNVASMTACF